MKKVFGLVLTFLMGILSVSAQQPQVLPLMPNVKTGKLANGLTYYILHNEKPENRANFYIAQKVGSTLEKPEQLGLAHFLEHMAFNGTKTYPGKNMLNYLQSKGIRFGADINAYTSFDETVYNINNVPTSDVPLMDSVLLVLRDWSGSILLEESEINAERGVIQEEWRSRNDAQTRMFTQILPKIYQEYQYQQMPIGKMEVVMNFKPEVLRAYYKKWYRPDQQGIVIVGDFDAAEMEKKVVELFSQIPMPENAAERTYPAVSDNEKPIYASFQDPEQKYDMIRVAFKYDKLPFEMRNTDMGYIQNNIIFSLLTQLLDNRLNEYGTDPACPYAQAGVYFGDFYVSCTKGSFNIMCVAKDDAKAAYESALGIVARALKTGFTDSEIGRARDQILANYDRMLKEKDKTNSDAFARELIRHFVDNEPAPGIEMENQIQNMVLNSITAAQLNQMCGAILTPNNQVIVVSAPEGKYLLTEEEAVGIVNNAINAQYEAYVDEVLTDPLIAKLPKKGKIKSTSSDKVYGTTTFTLSNGVKVVIKPTDFSSDQILMQGIMEGGKRSFSKSEGANVQLLGDVYNYAKMGIYDAKNLTKYLAGKNVGLTYSINNFTNILEGSSTVKDLPTLMELVYTSFTNLNPDQTTFDGILSQARVMLANQVKDPMFIFRKAVNNAQYGDNALLNPITVELLDQFNYDKAFSLMKSLLSNAADYTFTFVGNVDEATLRPLLEQYIATLPSKKKATPVQNVTDLDVLSGVINKEFKQKMQATTAVVFDLYSGDNVEFNTRNDILTEMVGDILDQNYTATLREEEGGTYGASVYSYLNPNTKQWQLLYNFQTNHEQKQSLCDRAYKELMNLLNNGAPEDYFNKVKQAAIAQLDNKEKTNGYWQNQILSMVRGLGTYPDYRKTLEGITLQDLNEFMKTLYNGKNHIEVIMLGSPEY